MELDDEDALARAVLRRREEIVDVVEARASRELRCDVFDQDFAKLVDDHLSGDEGRPTASPRPLEPDNWTSLGASR